MTVKLNFEPTSAVFESNPAQSAIQILTPEQLTLTISPQQFSFSNTAELLVNSHGGEDNILPQNPAWLLQAEAKKAAEFGLSIKQAGFNLLALGEAGTGRTTLMLSAMHEMANNAKNLTDLIALYQFDANGKPLFLKLPAGAGVQLKHALDAFVRQLGKALANLLDEKISAEILAPIKILIETQLAEIKANISLTTEQIALTEYFKLLQEDVIDYLEAWQPSASSDGDSHVESMLNEGFLGRYRANLLVGNVNAKNSPVIIDNDPSLHSLFGGVESAGETNTTPDFIRLRAGNLLRADGGVLILHLRDILADEQNGVQLLEKLHRFLRNGTLYIEDLSSSSSQGASFVSAQAAITVNVKLVLIATREDYYQMLEEKADFFSFFPIKVEFSEKVKANSGHYDAFALFIAQKCKQLAGLHFTAEAVAGLLQAMHRLEEDQTRLSTQLAVLEKLIVESIAVAELTVSPKEGEKLVEITHVNMAIARRYARHSYIEGHMRDTIVDQELMITVQGEAIGQINGLTHIDLADASFGSPVRISANCYPGARGVITIDREVTMSGPTHDKGVMILQSWLHQHFSELNPLNFTASLVFEQEYNGVDGDSASCAELFALISSLAQLPIGQGIAVTGAMNQHGEVLPVGGLNEKIEGYFRVCQNIGLNGKQGVLMPARNVRHLMLNADVINAVKLGQFHIATMNNVLEGLAYLTGRSISEINQQAATRLQQFKRTVEANRPAQTMQMP